MAEVYRRVPCPGYRGVACANTHSPRATLCQSCAGRRTADLRRARGTTRWRGKATGPNWTTRVPALRAQHDRRRPLGVPAPGSGPWPLPALGPGDLWEKE